MILFRICEAFNRWYWIGDSIKEGFNGKDGQYFELLTIMIGLAGSIWFNIQYQYHGIDNTPITEEEYQINNWIETGIGDRFDSTALSIICLAGSVWLNTQSQYCGIDDISTEKSIKLIIADTLYKRRYIQQAILN